MKELMNIGSPLSRGQMKEIMAGDDWHFPCEPKCIRANAPGLPCEGSCEQYNEDCTVVCSNCCELLVKD